MRPWQPIVLPLPDVDAMTALELYRRRLRIDEELLLTLGAL